MEFTRSSADIVHLLLRETRRQPSQARCLAERPEKRYFPQKMSPLPRRMQKLLLWGAVGSALGIGLAATGGTAFSAVVTVVGMLSLALGIHWTGRAGPDHR